MSSSSNPIQSEASPFVPTTTPAIERANRLLSVRSNPGFLDVLRILQEMAQEATDATTYYPGWDAQQIVVLKVRQQVACETKDHLLARINKIIDEGVVESRIQLNEMQRTAASTQVVREAIDSGDFVRQRVLEHFDENDLRAAGSF